MLRLVLLLLLALLLSACTIPGEAPPKPFPDPERKWQRVRWDAVETILEAREGEDGRLMVDSFAWRYRESGWHAVGAGRVALAYVEAGSRLRIDARDAAPALAARVHVDEIEATFLGFPDLREAPPGTGFARTARPDGAFERGVAEIAGPDEGASVIAISLAGAPQEDEVELFLERRRVGPIEYRWEGLEERAKRGLGPKLASAPKKGAPPASCRRLAGRLAAALPWDAPAAATGTALRRAEESFLEAAYFTYILEARASDLPLFFRERDAWPEGVPPAVRIDGHPLEAYAEADRGRSLEIEARGPALLVLETRVPYGPPDPGRESPFILAESEGARRYVLRVRRRPAEAPDAWVRAGDLFLASAADDLDSWYGVRRDGRGRPVSRRRTAFVLVPPGRHIFRVEAAEPVLVRPLLRTKKTNWRDAIDGSEDAERWLEEARAAAESALGTRTASDLRARFILAAADLLAGRAGEAASRFEALREETANGPEAERRGADLALGALAAGRGDLGGALAALDRAAAGKRDALAKEARLTRGAVLEAAGKPALAAEVYRRLAAEDPLDPDLFFALGRALLFVPGAELAEPAAVAALDHALELDPANEDARELRETARLHFAYLQTIAPAERRGLRLRGRSDEPPPRFADEVYVVDPPRRDPPPREGPGAALSPDQALALPADGELAIVAAAPTVARIEARPTSATAQLAVHVDGVPAIDVPLAGRAETIVLRLPLALGPHRVRLSGAPGMIAGAIAPGDPEAPRLRKLELTRLGGPAESLIYYPKEGDEAALARVFVRVPGEAARRAAIRVREDGGPWQRFALEGGREATPAGTLYRLRLALPAGRVRLEIAAEDEAGDLGIAVAILRRSRESGPAESFEDAPRSVALGGSSPDTASAIPGAGLSTAGEERRTAPPTAGEERRTAPLPPSPATSPATSPANASEGDLVARLASATAAIADGNATAASRAACRLARGETLLALERPRLAGADFLGVANAPEAPRAARTSALEGLADAYAMGGDPARSLAVRQALVDAEPRRRELRERLAWTALAASRPLVAVEQYKAILAAEPTSGEARLGLAASLARAFELTAARREVEALLGAPGLDEPEPATELAPLAARARYLEAVIALDERRPAEALRALDAALAALAGWSAPPALVSEPGEDFAGAPPSLLAIDRSEIEALRDLARRLTPPCAAAADLARPPLERARALVAIARLDARWILRARAADFATAADADVTGARRDRVASADTGRLGFLYDAGGGFLLRVEGPTIVRLDARADHPAVTASAEILVEPVSPLAPTARFLLDPDEPSPSLAYVDRSDIVPGTRQLFDVVIPPGMHVVRILSGARGVHVHPLVLSPGLEDPLGGGCAVEGARGASVAAAEALHLLKDVPDPPSPLQEPTWLGIEARVLAGIAEPAECAFYRDILAHRTVEDPLEHATMLAILGDRRGAIDVLLPAMEGDEARLLFALLASSGNLGPDEAPVLAALAGRPGGPRAAAKIARALIAVGKRADDAVARWFGRALLLLRDLRAASPEDAEVATLHEEALLRTDWRELTGATGTAGFERILLGAPLVSQRAEVADALLAEPRPPERGALATAGRGTSFDVRLLAESDLLLEVRAEDLLAEGAAVGLVAALDGAPPRAIAVPEGGAARSLFPRVAAGPHRLDVTLGAPGPGKIAKAYLYASRQALGGEARPAIEQDGRPFFPIVDRTSVNYRVATAERPLRVQVRGPAVLRIDARVTLAPTDPPRAVPVAIVLSPGANKAQSFAFLAKPSPSDAFRDLPGRVPSIAGRVRIPLAEDRVYDVLVRPETPGERLLVKMWARVDVPASTTRSAGSLPPTPSRREGASPGDGGSLARREGELGVSELEPPHAFWGEEDGTFEAFVRGAAIAKKGPEPDDRARQSFGEIGVAHRKFIDAAELWLLHEISVKQPDAGDPVLHFEGKALWRTPFFGVRWMNRLDLDGQVVAGKPEGSIDLETRLDRLLPLVRGDLDLYGALGWRAKEQTLDAFPRRIDRKTVYFDVFSPFYEHDSHWLYGRLYLFWRPFLDLEFYAGGGFNSNRDYDPGDLDRALFRAGVRGVEGPVAWELVYDEIHRLKDKNRAHANDESFVGVLIDAWLFAGRSWSVGVDGEARYYLESGEVGVYLGLRFLMSRGRVFRDFMPGEVRFEEDRGYLYREPGAGARP